MAYPYPYNNDPRDTNGRVDTLWGYRRDSYWNWPVDADAEYSGIIKDVGQTGMFRLDGSTGTQRIIAQSSDPTRTMYNNGKLLWGDSALGYKDRTCDDAGAGSSLCPYQGSLKFPDGHVLVNDDFNHSAALITAPDAYGNRHNIAANGFQRKTPTGPIFCNVLPSGGGFVRKQDIRNSKGTEFVHAGNGGSGIDTFAGLLVLGDLSGPNPIRHVMKIANPGGWPEQITSKPSPKTFPAHRSDQWQQRKTPCKTHWDRIEAIPGYTHIKGLMMGSRLVLHRDLVPADLGIQTVPGLKLFYALQNFGVVTVEAGIATCTTGTATLGTAMQYHMETAEEEAFEAAYGYPISWEEHHKSATYDTNPTPRDMWIQDVKALHYNSLRMVLNTSAARPGGGTKANTRVPPVPHWDDDPSPVNRPPVANAGNPQTVGHSESVQLNGSGIDPDGTIAAFAWTQTAGTTVTLSDAAIANPTFTSPSTNQNLIFQLIVTDNDGLDSVADTVTITVDDAPAPPVDNIGLPSEKDEYQTTKEWSADPHVLDVTITANTSHLVAAMLASGDDDDVPVDLATLNGVSFIGKSQVAQSTGAYRRRIEIFVIPQGDLPAAGTYEMVVDTAGACSKALFVRAVEGSDPDTTHLIDYIIGSQSSYSLSFTAPSAGLLIDFALNDNSVGVLTPKNGQADVINDATDEYRVSSTKDVTEAGSVSIGQDASSNRATTYAAIFLAGATEEQQEASEVVTFKQCIVG